MAKITIVEKQQLSIDEELSTTDALTRPKRPTTYFSGLSGSGVRGSIDPNSFARRLPTPFGETVGTSFDEALNEGPSAIQGGLFNEYQKYIDEIEAATGPSVLVNPYRLGAAGETVDRKVELDRFYSDLAELAKSNPGLPMRTHEDVIAAVDGQRQAVRDLRALAEAGEAGFSSGLGAFIGGSAGALADPVVTPTLFIGAPWSAGVLRFALTEAAIGAGTTALGQAAFQQARQEVGEEPSLREAVEQTLMAGVGAGIFGALLRGGGAGLGRIRRALSDRRTRLRMAETLPPKLRTPDVEAAMAVERRMLDIEEGNPLGRDVAAQAVHGQRFAAAEKALAEGRILPRREAIEGASFAHLSDLDKQAVSELVQIANSEPAKFADWIEALKALPKRDAQKAETFAQFVQRQVGLVADDATLKRLGVERDIDPVRFRREGESGKTLDQLATAAKRQGFFADKPTHEQLVSALREEIENGRALHRIDVDTGVPVSPARQIGVLDRLGVPFRNLEPQQVAARLRAISEAEAAFSTPQRTIRDLGDAEEANRGIVNADNERLTKEGEGNEQADLDAAREQVVRDIYAGKEYTILTLENPDGTIERMTVREMFERNKMEADELEALSFCLARGRR